MQADTLPLLETEGFFRCSVSSVIVGLGNDHTSKLDVRTLAVDRPDIVHCLLCLNRASPVDIIALFQKVVKGLVHEAFNGTERPGVPRT